MRSTIPARDLRNNTAAVLRRVEAGETIEVLRDSRPVALLSPVPYRRRWIPATEVLAELQRRGPETTGLAEDLRTALDETTADLG